VQSMQTIRAVTGFLLYLFLIPALLFIATGTADWPMAWVYTALLLASSVGSRLIVYRRSPETLRERARFTSSESTPRWDRVLVMIVGLIGPAAMALIAGLDRRWGWSPAVPAAVQVLGAILVAAGYGLAVWAMVENPYFSSVARLQQDRGQQVVTTGPYRIVRHPSYAGALLASVALPFMLGALWSLVPGILLGAALIARSALEDRMLLEGLDGYPRYAEKTRYRLVPGLW
jgi:protein-S-isoprenylcysteine O-methyltransferase Ste14